MAIPESPQPCSAAAVIRLAREQAKSPSKLRNKRSGKYASQKEEKRAWELNLLLSQGAISNLNEQVSYTLLPPCEGYSRPVRYVADFTFVDTEGVVHVEDVKPDIRRGRRFVTPMFELKKRLMWQLLGIQITEV